MAKVYAERSAKAGVNWFVMRVATASEFSETHRELKYRTPFADLLDMHIVLDTYEHIRREYERDRKSKKPPLPSV